jgi:hypothetical protein
VPEGGPVVLPISQDWAGRNRAKRLQRRSDENISKTDERPQTGVPPRHAGDSPILLAT